MNIGNDNSYSGTKINKKKMNYKKLSMKKNLQIMNDPAFHLNRTLKAYINYKLNKNISTEKIESLKNFVELTKTQNQNNSFIRAKTLSNIINKKKIFSKKKINKLIRPSHHSKKKKLLKSNSSNKLNLSNYLNFYNERSININNKINKSKILKKNSNNSQKYIRYSGSTALSNNDTNQILDKNNSIFPYNNNNNMQILTNHSTLDINSLKTPVVGQTTSKKNKFNAQYFSQNKDKNKFPNLSNIKNNRFKNFNLTKNRQNLNKSHPKNLIINDKINNQNINSNIINKTDNNINDNDFKYSYEMPNNNKDNTQKKILNNNINIGNINKNGNFNSNINANINKLESEIKKECDNKYLKMIEMLENENKILKGEINDSNNRLLLLEKKINELLLGKNSIENEKCPQPTPYVKKYSLETIQNLNQSPLTINTNSEIDNKNILKEIKNESKEKLCINKIQKNKPDMNYSKLMHLKACTQNHFEKEKKNVDTPTKINVNKFSKNLLIKKKEKKKICKKINNQKYFGNKKGVQFNFFTEESKNYH